eukprot:CAMPEP_0173410362 /NCGR_PEP_ID=MMETSP1356-20130122/74454_1 /TAXON_ID=77927 ORGANISM="Hemiselmis virescens, Strain PCC157" /NCGR_SAMPLE_ID=MMETSP1356 /ASSEMBLY_ACC=CAM_ASM_000847 /LENGTH=86 /DNA_ID=CAMNT_0014371977 /DNA_START=182 /DNA_END=442 /DNA_ORIENTATION=+
MIEINTPEREACGGSDDKWTATKAWQLQYCCTCAVLHGAWSKQNHDKWACNQCLEREGVVRDEPPQLKRVGSDASSTGTFDEDDDD